MKKLGIQMNREEQKSIVNRVRKLQAYKFLISKHAYERMEQRNISLKDVQGVLNNFQILEFNNETANAVALLKGRGKYWDVIVSINLQKGNLLTAYKNAHYTPNISNSNPNIDVKNMLRFYKIKKTYIKKQRKGREVI